MPSTSLRRVLAGAAILAVALGADRPEGDAIFGRENLVAWCVVPFDAKKRSPEERAAMLERLGFKHFAYDWRPEHVPTFDAEVEALKKHGVALDAFWVAPGELNEDSRRVLELLKRHGVKAQLWALLDLGGVLPPGNDAEQERRVATAASKLGPLAREAKAVGCSVGLYNHGGWYGEPENQIAVIERLKAEGVDNVGMVYNLHHGHAHVGRLAEVLRKAMPYLYAVNLNGTDPNGESNGRKILPIGQGSLDLSVLRTVRDSGYRGPVGILGHTQDDAGDRLRDNLDGLAWLVPQLVGKPAGEKPTPRTPVPPSTASEAADAKAVADLLADARSHGDPSRGAEVFADPKFACLTCHKAGGQGGEIGPDLSRAGVGLTPEHVVESLLWPGRRVKEGYEAVAVALTDGKVVQGYKVAESGTELTVRDVATGQRLTFSRGTVEGVRDAGSLMPAGLSESMSPEQRRDVVAFLGALGKPGAPAVSALRHAGHAPATFAYDRGPLRPGDWPSWQAPVNRERLYDFYAKEADHFAGLAGVPTLLPQFPGLDGGVRGHWGNQDETTWADDRWNATDVGTLMSGVFRGAGVTVPKGVCVRLGEKGEVSACFNPETLCYEAVWSGGFVKFSDRRHGFLDGLIMDGEARPRPEGSKPDKPFVYRGFYRHGNRVVFAYTVDGVETLDAPWVDDRGEFARVVGPAETHPLRNLTRGGGGGAPRWPEAIVTKGALGSGRPYAVDTIAPPFKNPWNALLFFGDHDFLPDGSALLGTMTGDVWRVDGLDETLANVRWRRYASGLHQALGLVVENGRACVLGRDQVTRLHDLDGDGEADFHECVSNAHATSPAGHDFVCGLQRDAQGRFYASSGPQGLIRISADGQTVETLATGFRNPDGLGLTPDGRVTVPSSEGDWVCASMVCEVRPEVGGHFGYPGPRDGKVPSLPLLYLPRGADNSSGGQASVDSDRWGPLKGQMLHFSFGAGAMFLLLRDEVGGQPQGAAVPIAGEFRSGAHRGRFNPKDGQLYVSGMNGWGSYTPDDGSFQRVRYAGGPVRLPVAVRARENGVLVTFAEPVDRAFASDPKRQFAQSWNYRYGPAYGSPEFSPSHRGTPGHDALAIRSSHVLDDGKTVFLELPGLQPVDQLHLHLRPDAGPAVDVFATVHKLAPPFTGFAGYAPTDKTIAAHPILADLAEARIAKPNPWKKSVPGARGIGIEARGNLTFSQPALEARAGEWVKLTFRNPDVVPHNWALVKPGTLAKVGDLANKLIADPEAAARQYVPDSPDVIAYTDIVPPGESFSISFKAPAEPGRYPYLCTFPGHWMVMNGELIVR